jgi:hypothetical protein
MASPSPSPVCDRCQDFDIQVFARSPGRSFGFPLSSVIKSARKGCSFCNLLVGSLAEIERRTGSSLINTVRGFGSYLDRLGLGTQWVHLHADVRSDTAGAAGMGIARIKAFASVWRPGSGILGDPQDLWNASPRCLELNVAADEGELHHKYKLPH